MKNTKATFRALREACGLSQFDIADEFDVDVRSVKRWERQGDENPVPDDVWQWMAVCYNDMMARSLALADTIAAGHKDGTPAVLPYFRTQDDLDAVQLPLGQDQPVGHLNATVRQVLCWLLKGGVDAWIEYNGEGNNVIAFDDLILDQMLDNK